MPNLFISGDVEASGQCPGMFDLISIGLIVIEPGLTRSFYGEMAPLHDNFQQGAYDAIGMTREQHLAMPSAEETMQRMKAWCRDLLASCGGRLVFISDNNGFDFAFLNWYCWKFLSENPFGHSSRRIGDFCAGVSQNFQNTQGWKKRRITAHTHNALDDARGNAEAIMDFMAAKGVKAPWDKAA